MGSAKPSVWLTVAVLTFAELAVGADLPPNNPWLEESLPCLRTLLERSRYGMADLEVAAWLVESQDGRGELSCVFWPPTDFRGVARWSAPLPRGLRAQAHSHSTRAASGRHWGSVPSRQDCMTARQLGLPVLTVTTAGVYECRPGDGKIIRLLGTGWMGPTRASD